MQTLNLEVHVIVQKYMSLVLCMVSGLYRKGIFIDIFS